MPIVRELDFTSSLPSGCTFSRVGSRNAVQSGLMVSVAENIPAFESTGSEPLGLSIQGASSNLITTLDYPNDFQRSTMNVDPVANSLTGANDAWDISPKTTSNAFRAIQYVKSGLTAGQRLCFSVYASAIPSSIKRLFNLTLTNEYDNGGAYGALRNDNIAGITPILDPDTFQDIEVGFERVNSEWIRYYISGVKQITGTGTFALRSSNFDTAQIFSAGDPLHRIRVFNFQLESGVRRPASALGLGTVSRDVLQITDVSGFNASEATIVIEHDVRNGDLLQESGSPIITATKPGKIALAWSGSSSSLCSNGEGVVAGGAVSIVGALDVMPSTVGHIKSITVYDERLTDAELVAVTRKTGSPQSAALRICTTHNRLPSYMLDQPAGVNNIVRYPFRVTHDVKDVQLVFNNWTSGLTGDINGSTLNVVKCALEYGGSFTPVTFSGNAGITLNPGDSDIKSDAIGSLAAGTEGYIRCETSGTDYPVSRFTLENGASAFYYNTATATMSDVYGTGPLTVVSGSGLVSGAQSYCPVMVGVPSDPLYDPPALFHVGDSLSEGTGSLNNTGTFVLKSCIDQNIPLLLHGVGGQNHYHRDYSVKWRDMLQYTRMMSDNMYVNSPAGIEGAVHSIYKAARDAGVDRIFRVETFPNSDSTDDWATQQTVESSKVKPNNGDNASNMWLESGYIDGIIPCTGIYNEVDTGWVLNGTPFYMTVDGIHQNTVSDDIVATNMSTFLSGVTLDQPELEIPSPLSVFPFTNYLVEQGVGFSTEQSVNINVER